MIQKLRKAGLKRIVNAALLKLYHLEKVIIFQLDLHSYDLHIQAKLPIVIRMVNAWDIPGTSTMDDKHTLDNMLQLLKHGEKGFFAYYKERGVGRAWVVEGPQNPQIFYEFAHFSIGPSEIFIHYCATDPIFRKNNIYSALLNTICLWYKEKGYRRAVIAVSKNNQPSIHGIKKAGFIPVAEINIMILLNKVFTNTKKVCIDDVLDRRVF